MPKWIDPQPIDVSFSLRSAVGGHPLVAETLARRGITDVDQAKAFLNPDLYQPAAASDLPDLERAAERLRRAAHLGEQVIVWGDFDADGQTSAAVLVETLRALDADVAFHIPSRDQGHGLHSPELDRLIKAGARLFLTCDTGVTAHSAVTFANSRGAQVIVTDHHVPDETLPPAFAVVNTHRVPSVHPKASLPGVGVAYELARTLEPTAADAALDLVALGTIADVAALKGDTRYYVQRGLAVLRNTDRTGLRAVFEAAELHAEGITEEHVGFLLAPRLNSLGRLADASRGVELLTTDDPVRARTLAIEVEGLNARRRWLTKQVTDAALSQLDHEPELLEAHHALVLSQAAWPPGVIGIVASRLAERFGKPTVLIASPQGETARGSGRSVPGVSLIQALRECSPLLKGYGGHAGAAGFSIEPERIPDLRVSLSRAVAAQVATLPKPSLAIDAFLELDELTLDLVNDLNRLAPFGQGNPPLNLVIRDLHITAEAIIGRTAEHRRISVQDQSGHAQTVFWWHGADWGLPQGRFDLACNLRTSNYRGVTEVQVEWIDSRELEAVAITERRAPAIRLHDYRGIGNAEAVLQGLVAKGDVQVWAEGRALPVAEARNRTQLQAGPHLVVWSLPPGPQELMAVIARVQPSSVSFFGRGPELDEPAAFLTRIAGLAKYALRAKDGEFNLEQAAAACSQRIPTIVAGLDWLVALGQLRVTASGEDTWQLVPGLGRSDGPMVEVGRAHAEALLGETAAFRDYLAIVPASSLVESFGAA